MDEEVQYYFNKGGLERLCTISQIEARGEWAIVHIPDEVVIGKECEVWEVWVGGRLLGPRNSFADAEAVMRDVLTGEYQISLENCPICKRRFSWGVLNECTKCGREVCPGCLVQHRRGLACLHCKSRK